MQSFHICVFMGTVFSPLPSSKAPGYGTVGCVGVLVTEYYLSLPILVRCSVLNGHPPAWIYHVFVWVTPGTHVFYNHASTGDGVPAIVLGSYCSPGTFCGSNMKFVAKKLSMRPLHSTAFAGTPAGASNSNKRQQLPK